MEKTLQTTWARLLIGWSRNSGNDSSCNYYWEFFVNGTGCLVGKIKVLELTLTLPLILTLILIFLIRIRGKEKLVMCASSLILLSLGNRAGC